MRRIKYMNSLFSTTQLTQNYTISRVLKGGWQLSEGHSSVDKKNAVADMFAYVDAGITTFDFGDIYTGVEELIGKFLEQYTNRNGKESRDSLQLHTKFVPDLDSLKTLTKRDVENIIDRSLYRLGVNEIDLVQFHWWDFSIPRYVEVGHILRELQEKGKIKHIGVTNFDVLHLNELLESGLPIISNQVQFSVLDYRPENGMIHFCEKNDIKLLCYGTLAGGFLSQKYLNTPEPKAPYENRSLTKYKLIIDDFGGWNLFQELLGLLHDLAIKYNCSIANIASKYILDKPQVSGIVVGARDLSHLKDNLNIFNIVLDEIDSKKIDTIVKKAIGPKGDIYGLEREKGGKHAVIMKYNLNKVI